MKLRSGKILYTYLPDAIINPIMLELKKTIDTLKVLLEDDKLFLKRVVELSLLLGKGEGVYMGNIDEIVRAEYPPIPKGQGTVLLYKVYDLGGLIFGDHLCIKQELSKLSIDAEDEAQWEIVRKILRTEIEKGVINNVFSESAMGESLSNVVGESEQSFEEI